MLRAMEQMSRISSRDVECEAKNTSAQRERELSSRNNSAQDSQRLSDQEVCV